MYPISGEIHPVWDWIRQSLKEQTDPVGCSRPVCPHEQEGDPMRRSVIVTSMAALVAAACSSGPQAPTSRSPAPRSPTSPAPTTATPSQPVARLASGAALPSICTPEKPTRADTATFVSSGHAWAISSDGARLACLFDVQDPGPFVWGPLGDRALLGSFEVKGLPGALTLPQSDVRSGPISWGRPTGKSIVLVSAEATGLEKVHLDGDPLEDITPLSGARYLSVTYHPSGLALAFAVERGGGQSIWMSSNTGDKPKRMVFSMMGTKFGVLGFRADGEALYYGALHADGRSVLHELSLTDPSAIEDLWAAPAGQQILDILPGLAEGSLAWTIGSSCDDSVAMIPGRSGDGAPALPGESTPTRVVGWLDAQRVLVATGECSGQLDLAAVNASTGAIVPLVLGADAAAVRTPARTPPPPLPTADVGSGNA